MSAFQNPNLSVIATGDINPSRFVTLSGSLHVAESNAGEVPVGVSQPGTKLFNSSLAAASGDVVGVFAEAQECWLLFGGTVTAGDRLKSDADGKGVTAGATDPSGAVALESGSSGGLYRVRVEIDAAISS